MRRPQLGAMGAAIAERGEKSPFLFQRTGDRDASTLDSDVTLLLSFRLGVGNFGHGRFGE